MTQKIKYQGTAIEPEQSAHEIGKLVSKYGARQFSLHWDQEGTLTGITFVLVDQMFGAEVPVKLGARTETIEEILRSSRVLRKYERRIEQAQRIAWRQLKDLVEQLLLAARTGLWSVTEAFMAGVVIETDMGAETVGEYFARMQPQLGQTGGLKLLEGGKRHD